ncbi:IF4E-domain-containing protein [Patellaria atrata CBS 101060]|uniref:IF4E-domain-containing protein n=1 Tax=Patellaria atrata CBS 101060 TaxID=1346257 RepID=A0A9P4SEH5_9PEZI|nr:IF4E-domain-containing protein [Patellaria atrata CBS 101060]
MDRDRDNLWTRRSNSSKLSLSTSGNDHNDHKNDHPTRNYSGAKRFGGGDSSHGGRNPFNAISPLTTGTISSPTAGASTAFGLGSGAFASFGSASKTPKTPGPAIDFSKAAGTGTTSPSTPGEKKDKLVAKPLPTTARGTVSKTIAGESTTTGRSSADFGALLTLKYTWVIWYRPPTSKNSDYEKSTKPMCKMATAQEFWTVYSHLKRPSSLPTVSDYHFFKEGIRPVWEDEENKKGGKWIMRLKKGVSDRYWEDLLMAMIGDQFAEAGEEVCGAVLSVRSGEDVFSIWTKNDGGRNIKIRETIKRVLSLPPDTNIIWKSHDDSIAQRTAIDQAREKSNHHQSDKRRTTLTSDDLPSIKEKTNSS